MDNNVDIAEMAQEFNNRRRRNRKLKEKLLNIDSSEPEITHKRRHTEKPIINDIRPFETGYFSPQGEYSPIQSDESDTITIESIRSNYTNGSMVSIPQQMKSDLNNSHLSNIHNDDKILLHIKQCKKCQHQLAHLMNSKEHDFDYKQILIIILICVFVVLLIDFFRRK